jgi:hypothetical protein
MDGISDSAAIRQAQILGNTQINHLNKEASPTHNFFVALKLATIRAVRPDPPAQKRLGRDDKQASHPTRKERSLGWGTRCSG